MHLAPTDAALQAAILRSTVFPCIATDADGMIRVFNAGAERLLGYSGPDLVGRHRFAELCDAPEPTSRTRSAEAAFDLLMVRENGVRLPVKLSVSALQDPQGGVIGYLLLAADNREPLRLERERLDREADLRQSNKLEAIGTLAGGVAHDFNNILATILGNADLAQQDATGNPQVLYCLEEIHRAGVRGRDLVQQILSFARKVDTELKPLLLEPVVRESARLLRATLPGRLSIDVSCEPDMPRIAGDSGQIMQVLINLATNALQAMPAGQGTLYIRVASVRPGGPAPSKNLRRFTEHHPEGVVSITVRDTGCGMTPEILSKIFDPFFTTRPPGEGTGLGLSLVHGIVTVHQGLIEVDSAPGRGTTFSLYFPAVSGPSVDATAPVAGAATAVRAVLGRRVMYVDDDEALVSLVPRILQRRGFRVTAYSDAQRALSALRASPADFDLLLTDYNMPATSGLDVAREARALRADLPVVIITGYVDDTLRAQAAIAGVRDVIFKADTADALCDALQRVVESIPERKAGDGN